MGQRYDLIVLGAGNAGQAAAGVAREAGWRVLIVESRDVGGTCPLRGCVPKKVWVAASETLEHIRRAKEHGISVSAPTLDWPTLLERKQTFVRGAPAEMEKSLRDRGIDLLHGRARFVDRTSVEVNGTRYDARKVLVATGSKPRALTVPGGDLAITSDDILELAQRPDRMVFVGAGVIGLEFAHVFARAGTRVTVLENGARPLLALDEQLVSLLVDATRAIGVELLAGVSVKAIETKGAARVVQYEHQGRTASLEADVVANGTGRVADVEGLALDEAGIRHERGRIEVDAYLRSVSNPDVFVAGDALVGRPQLSALATHHGRVVGHNLLHEPLRAPDDDFVPSAVFTTPVLASVGRTEERARRDGLAFDVKANDMRGWKSGRTYAEVAAFAKVLIEKDSDRILGAHLLGHGAAEIIHTFALAMKHGIPAAALRENVFVYPSFSSDIKYML